MKTLLLLGALLVPAMGAERLEDLRWKKRVLVLTEKSPEVEKKLTATATEISERDVVVFGLKGGVTLPNEKLAKDLRDRLAVREGVAEVLLLGKDGRTTLRWKAADFEVKDLLRKIDSMPMRQQEMKR